MPKDITLSMFYSLEAVPLVLYSFLYILIAIMTKQRKRRPGVLLEPKTTQTLVGTVLQVEPTRPMFYPLRNTLSSINISGTKHRGLKTSTSRLIRDNEICLLVNNHAGCPFLNNRLDRFRSSFVYRNLKVDIRTKLDVRV